jgi:hypothetical protein
VHTPGALGSVRRPHSGPALSYKDHKVSAAPTFIIHRRTVLQLRILAPFRDGAIGTLKFFWDPMASAYVTPRSQCLQHCRAPRSLARLKIRSFATKAGLRTEPCRAAKHRGGYRFSADGVSGCGVSSAFSRLTTSSPYRVSLYSNTTFSCKAFSSTARFANASSHVLNTYPSTVCTV